MLFTGKFTEIVQIAPQVLHLTMEVPQKFTFIPGQFALLDIMLPNGTKVKRAYSIASDPALLPKMELCVKIVDGGIASPQFAKVVVGSEMNGVGPLGNFVLRTSPRAIVFIATGTGIAPFRSMVHELLAKGFTREIYILFGARYETDILYKDEFEVMSSSWPNLHYLTTLSRASDGYAGNRGYVQELLDEVFPRVGEADFYICGVSDMVKEVQRKLKEQGVPDHMVFCEVY